MQTRRNFIEAILDDPANDLLRLVFADWLEEHDEPERAEFIRVQIELSGMEIDFEYPSRFRSLQDRERELFYAHVQGWLRGRGDHIFGVPTAFGSLDNLGDWNRGFPQTIATSAQHFASDIDVILDHEPAEDIRLYLIPPQLRDPEVTAWLDELAADPKLRFVTYLEVEGGSRLPDERFARLIASPHLTRLRTLWCTAVIGTPGIDALCDNPAVSGLRSATFHGTFGENPDQNAVTLAARRIAGCPNLAGLSDLGFRGWNLRTEALEALLGSLYLSRELSLGLAVGDWRPPPGLAAALAGRFRRVGYL